MRIGIIGLGVVGGAVKRGLEHIGHDVVGFDIRMPETKFEDVLDTEAVFICVPTPCHENGMCDSSRVALTAGRLAEAGYRGVTVVKSTVTPGTTEELAARHPLLRLAFCPEFLHERAAFADFVENHDVCVIGTRDDAAYETVKRAHGSLPKSFAKLTPTEAELCKYYSNVFNALRIVFANEFHDVAAALGADYTAIKNAMVQRSSIQDVYLECNERFRGFGGPCLPKDTEAFAALVRQLGLDLKLFETIVRENKKMRITVPDGMRDKVVL